MSGLVFPAFPKGPNAFKALAILDWKDGKVPTNYSPWVTGYLSKGEQIELTWTPPGQVLLRTVRLNAPEGTYIHSLKVGAEETVDPRMPLPWVVLGETSKPLDLGIALPVGGIITMHLERPEQD